MFLFPPASLSVAVPPSSGGANPQRTLSRHVVFHACFQLVTHTAAAGSGGGGAGGGVVATSFASSEKSDVVSSRKTCHVMCSLQHPRARQTEVNDSQLRD